MMEETSNDMYDAFSSDYDRFVNWPGRLAIEMPFIETQLASLKAAQPGALRLLDAACGTGQHALALAQRGHAVCGADLSSGMINRARANAALSGLKVDFKEAGFGSLAGAFAAEIKSGGFDALLCLGNSLPHLTDAAALSAALLDFANCLRPGGLLLIQNRNFDAVLDAQERWMEPQSAHEGGRDWLFLRFYDFRPDGLIQFNLINLNRAAVTEGWKQSLSSSLLYPLRRSELENALAQAGFGGPVCYGGLNGSPFEAASSSNLVIMAQRS